MFCARFCHRSSNMVRREGSMRAGGKSRLCLAAVKIKCLPLQQELYRTYLLIQDIDPTARLSTLRLSPDPADDRAFFRHGEIAR